MTLEDTRVEMINNGGGINRTYRFIVYPPTDTPRPIEYTWTASGGGSIRPERPGSSIAWAEWDSPGEKTVTVVVENSLGSKNVSYTFDVPEDPISPDDVGSL